jgi:hypothetical protein
MLGYTPVNWPGAMMMLVAPLLAAQQSACSVVRLQLPSSRLATSCRAAVRRSPSSSPCKAFASSMVDAADGMDMTPAHCPRSEAGPSSERLTSSKRPREEDADQEEAALTGGVDTPPAEAGVQAAGAAGAAPRSEAGSPGEEGAAAAAAGPSTGAVSVLASTWPWNRDVGGPDDVARVVRSQQGGGEGGSLGSLRRGDQERSVSAPVLAGAERTL